ncbi:MAG: GntR family transcriptional regulator [Kiritimatiellia bacterium]
MHALFHLQINPNSGVPVYRQVMDQIRYYVAAGQLKPGDMLPSIRDLAGTLHINPNTIIKAYNELQHQNVIRIQHGKGAFIAEAMLSQSSQEREKEFGRIVKPLAAAAVQMGLSADRAAKLLRDEISNLTKGDQE